MLEHVDVGALDVPVGGRVEPPQRLVQHVRQEVRGEGLPPWGGGEPLWHGGAHPKER